MFSYVKRYIHENTVLEKYFSKDRPIDPCLISKDSKLLLPHTRLNQDFKVVPSKQ